MSTSEQSLFCLGISHAVDPICNDLHIQVGRFRNLGCSLHTAPHMFVTAASDDQVLGESVRLFSLLRWTSTLPGPFQFERLMHRLAEVLLIKIKHPVQNICDAFRLTGPGRAFIIILGALYPLPCLFTSAPLG